MEGGVAILLLLMIVAAAAVAIFLLTGAGGAISLRRRGESKRDAGDGERPLHKRPTSPSQEHTRLAGVDEPPDRSDAA